MKIGVAISARNRNLRTAETVAEWVKRLPKDAVLVIVDDCSEEPIVKPRDRRVTLIRHDYQRGIAMTKNRSIAALMDAGADHLFLADNDVYPVTDDWWKPYVESPEPHLSYQWPSGYNWREIYRDSEHFAVAFPRGVMLYAERRVIDTVGGMDAAYGAHGGEHVEWATRIHKAGLTRWDYADVVGSEQIWFSHDKETGNREGSTYPLSARREMCDANGKIWDKERPQFIPYREGEGGQPTDLGTSLGPKFEDTLDHVLTLVPSGTALEFGTGSGDSARRIAARMPLVTFGSNAGLPEVWEPGRFEIGHFACETPEFPANVEFVEGLFEDTLPNYDLAALGHIALIHIDCDLYSSTVTVLNYIRLEPGVVIVFDEFHGAPRCADHERRAWTEFCAANPWLSYTVIGHGPEQLALRVV